MAASVKVLLISRKLIYQNKSEGLRLVIYSGYTFECYWMLIGTWAWVVGCLRLNKLGKI